MRKVDSLLVLLGPALLVCLSAVFVRRKLYREFPFFFAYVIMVTGVAVTRFSVINDYSLYFKVFWLTEALVALFTLLALYEVFRNVFSEFYDLWWWFRLIFPGFVGLLAFFEIINTIHHPPAQSPPLIGLILSCELTVNWIEAALFGLMCLLVWLVGNWEYYPVGIAMGFAVSAVGSWTAYAARSIFGTEFNVVGKYGPGLAYFLAVLIWLTTFLRPPRPELWNEWSKTITPDQMLAEVREYLRILNGAFKRDR
jgi:hypothetical protein